MKLTPTKEIALKHSLLTMGLVVSDQLIKLSTPTGFNFSIKRRFNTEEGNLKFLATSPITEILSYVDLEPWVKSYGRLNSADLASRMIACAKDMLK